MTELMCAASGAELDLIQTRLQGFVPERVFDMHAHLVNPALAPLETLAPYLSPSAIHDLDRYRAAVSGWLGRPTASLAFGLPQAGIHKGAVNAWVAGETEAET